MAGTNFPEAWDNYFLLSIQRRGASAQSEIQFAAIIEPSTWEVSGEIPASSIVNAAGGRVWGQEPHADIEIKFGIIPIELDSTSGVGLFQQYIGVSGTSDPNAYDTAEPLTTDTSFPAGIIRNRDRFRITNLWTNDAAATTAAGSTASSTDAHRFFANNCLFVNMEPNMRDNRLKATVTFKCKPFNKAGSTMNYGYQSGNQTALASLTAYTTGNFAD